MEKFAAKRRMRGQGGFTLIELLVVIAILAVLGGAVIIGVGSLRGNAQAEVCKTDRETIETAIQAYEVANDGAKPAFSDLTAGTKPLIKKNLTAGDWTILPDGETVNASATGKYKDVRTECNA